MKGWERLSEKTDLFRNRNKKEILTAFNVNRYYVCTVNKKYRIISEKRISGLCAKYGNCMKCLDCFLNMEV